MAKKPAKKPARKPTKPAKATKAPAPKKKPAKDKPKAKKKAPARRPLPKVPDDAKRALLAAIDAMQDQAPGSTVAVKTPPESRARIPWLLLAVFRLPGGSTYQDVFHILSRWQADDKHVARYVNPQRLSRIQVKYKTERGKTGEYTLAEIGTWTSTLARAIDRVSVDDDGEDGLMHRYGEDTKHQSDIGGIAVWFSHQVGWNQVE